MFDILIRNATLVDGSGAPPRQADIGVKDGLIAEVGAIDAPAARTIEAQGLTVTPGFVDIHTHYDGQASWDPLLAPTSLNGVTSLAMGNCGVGFAPARPDRHDWLIALLEGVEDIPGTALAEGLSWDWESFPDYLDALGRRRFALDVAAHLPHAALRTYVMGDRGADHRDARVGGPFGVHRRQPAEPHHYPRGEPEESHAMTREPSLRQASQRGISLLVVEKGTPGFSAARPLKKFGWRCSDTAELVFDDVRLPASAMLPDAVGLGGPLSCLGEEIGRAHV